MPSRPPQAKTNTVADALVAALRAIDSVRSAGKWRTAPVTVERELKVADVTLLEKPAVIVTVASEEGMYYAAGPHYETTVRFDVEMLVNSPGAGEETMHNLKADIQDAIAGSNGLGGLVSTIYTTNYTLKTDPLSRAGYAAGVLTVEAYFIWALGAP